ncbi:Hypothetical predicted protein [Cloeon dipterum]|uniref:SH2 domain-containing protein n=1 Tax=Cloeon dipterum TaxID=197152 RepID=A0A8S1D792_9INSE|nr:Hypothetical predicted protein [Cloeon dipterum]
MSTTTDSIRSLPREKWLHGKISREQTEELLTPREDGLFLVRESTNYPGDYTLCICFQGKVEHYRIKHKDKKLTIDDEEIFDSLGQLVKHYEQDADGLCTQLIKSRSFFCADDKNENLPESVYNFERWNGVHFYC